MKEKERLWMLAIFIGAVLPGLVFSVAEKLYPFNRQENMVTTTEETIGKVDQLSDAVSVLQTNGTIKQIEMNDYLTGVLLGEMPADFAEDALKAQAVVARTYAQKRLQTGNKHPQGAVCTEASCCQAYCAPNDYLSKGGKQETVTKFQNAVGGTTGQVLTYEDQLIEATYFSCSGGKTEDAMAVWGSQIPYLQSVDSPGEEGASHYQDHIQFTAREFALSLGFEPLETPSMWFGNVTYTSGGGVDTIEIAGHVYRGVDLRQKLGLYSTVFSIVPMGSTVHIYTKGFGHRVGMSQYGAEAMAVAGSDYTKILAHYYPGTELVSYFD